VPALVVNHQPRS